MELHFLYIFIRLHFFVSLEIHSKGEILLLCFFFSIEGGRPIMLLEWEIYLLYSTVKYVLDHHLYNMQKVLIITRSYALLFHPIFLYDNKKIG